MEKNIEKSIFIEGLLPMISAKSVEKPNSTFLGSTDRKGYTIETTVSFRNETKKLLTHIQPFVGDQEGFVKRIEENAIHRLAEYIFENKEKIF